MISFILPFTKIKIVIAPRTWFDQNWLVKKYRRNWVSISKSLYKNHYTYIFIDYPTKETFRKHEFEIHETPFFPEIDNYIGEKLNW
jgi:hypothetical protein